MSIALVTATQCTGMVLFHEKDVRVSAFFVDKLVGMGARIVSLRSAPRARRRPFAVCGEHRRFPDIRAGMAMLLAAMCAEGESTINNVGPDRARLRAN
jgi:UDP-N-acetylglucosamine 1-carboxyvinyltransferase